MSRELDRIDLKILEELESNGRLPMVELAARVNLSNTPCSERVKRLERKGYIRGYKAVLDLSQLEAGHVTVVQVSLEATAENYLDRFNRAVARVDEIETCLLIAGSFDYLLVVRTRDMAHFRMVLGEKINNLPGIRQTNSFAVMETVKEDYNFKSPH
ncbi:winged helix-turn-helix transcriptional regulator [Epibacterium sp. SM1969]|uniref:Winged helix-turn-helix transcriptional regulator n=1 Tax=Tritonibacter aquimaris TaxID=2663379 RepID=A0A844AN48_9RHOB|nr:Lrp/AsnC ligand binding domain-containing protein [Tritonibacter aquimaris]MQY43649.1 winged helix-turn-helix transcriptional regulator [Tritonibacter aquimaris]